MTISTIDEEAQEVIYKIFGDKLGGSLSKVEVYPKLKCLMFQIYSINTDELDMLWHMFSDMNIRMTADVKTAMIRVLIQEKPEKPVSVPTGV